MIVLPHPSKYASLKIGYAGSTASCYAFFEYVASVTPAAHKRILEVGTHLGVSSAAWATGAKNSIVDTVDPQASVEDQAARKETWMRFGVEDRIRFHNGDSREVLPGLVKDAHFDIAFIDGSHVPSIVIEDLKNVAGRSDVIVMHDCGFDQEEWQFARTLGGYFVVPTMTPYLQSDAFPDWRGCREAIKALYPEGTAEVWNEGKLINPAAEMGIGMLVAAGVL